MDNKIHSIPYEIKSMKKLAENIAYVNKSKGAFVIILEKDDTVRMGCSGLTFHEQKEVLTVAIYNVYDKDKQIEIKYE
jgi:hypothetical protein